VNALRRGVALHLLNDHVYGQIVNMQSLPAGRSLSNFKKILFL
jgi:hypothetical protein